VNRAAQRSPREPSAEARIWITLSLRRTGTDMASLDKLEHVIHCSASLHPRRIATPAGFFDCCARGAECLPASGTGIPFSCLFSQNAVSPCARFEAPAVAAAWSPRLIDPAKFGTSPRRKRQDGRVG
jgi:hypothetical protein